MQLLENRQHDAKQKVLKSKARHQNALDDVKDMQAKLDECKKAAEKAEQEWNLAGVELQGITKEVEEQERKMQGDGNVVHSGAIGNAIGNGGGMHLAADAVEAIEATIKEAVMAHVADVLLQFGFNREQKDVFTQHFAQRGLRMPQLPAVQQGTPNPIAGAHYHQPAQALQQAAGMDPAVMAQLQQQQQQQQLPANPIAGSQYHQPGGTEAT